MPKKLFLIIVSILFVNTYLAFSLAQDNHLNIDLQSADSLRVDTLINPKPVAYSEFIFLDPNRPNHYLDSLKNKITVKNGDFITAIKNYNDLMQAKIANIGEATPKFQRPIWILITVFGLFLTLAVVRNIFPLDFSVIVQAFYKDRMLMQISKEENMTNSWSYIFLYLIFSTSLSLFLLITQSGFANFNYLNPTNYLKIAVIVTFLFILKILIIRFIAFVFLINRIVREYIAVIYLTYFNSLFVLMPFLLMITFIPEKYFKMLLIVFSVIVCLMFVYRFVRTAFNFVGNSKFSIFYLFLYLCSLEVAPILILVKTLSN